LSTVTFTTPVQEQIKLVEERIRAQADENHPDLRAALEHLLSSGGKRVRPTVVLLVGNMLGGPEEKLVTLGAASRIATHRHARPRRSDRWFPAATRDADVERTLVPCCYRLDRRLPVCARCQLAAEADHLPLMNAFAETLATIVNGELTQLFTSRGLINRENYYQRIYAKTASLFEMSAQGRRVWSAPWMRNWWKLCACFGTKPGWPFQIVDDILDFTGDQTAVGKPLGSDLLQGLVTLPAIYFAEANPDDPDVLLLGEGGWGNHDRMERLVNSIRKSDAIQKSMREAEDFIKRALEKLSSLHPGIERSALEDLAKYTSFRTVTFEGCL
jgi:geranylgeranyl pyrophosphate synthase